MARLLFAEQVARASQIQISCADRKSRTQPVERHQRGHPQSNLPRISGIRSEKEKGPARGRAATNPPQKVRKLGRAEEFGPPYQDCVGPRYVEPAFDDVGGQK